MAVVVIADLHLDISEKDKSMEIFGARWNNYTERIKANWNKIQSSAFSRDWYYFYADINGRKVPVVSFCHPQVTNLCGKRGHEALFKPLYKDMQAIGNKLLRTKKQ